MRVSIILIGLGLMLGSAVGAASAAPPKVPEKMTVEIRKQDVARGSTIRAILQVCRYMEETYPLDHKRADCLAFFSKWVPKSDR